MRGACELSPRIRSNTSSAAARHAHVARKLQWKDVPEVEVGVGDVPQRPPKFISDADREKLVDNAARRLVRVRGADVLCGARSIEAAGVREEDFDLENGTVFLRHRKSGRRTVSLLRERRVPIPEWLVDAVRPMLTGQPKRPLYSYDGASMDTWMRRAWDATKGKHPRHAPTTRPSGKMIETTIEAVAKEQGLTERVTSHWGRHTFATLVMKSGKHDIFQLMEWLGHADIKQTLIYAHHHPDYDKGLRETLARVVNRPLPPGPNAAGPKKAKK